jgi:hypothetical protein
MGMFRSVSEEILLRSLVARDSFPSLTFALHRHFQRSAGRIRFAFNGSTAQMGQVKTFPLF